MQRSNAISLLRSLVLSFTIIATALLGVPAWATTYEYDELGRVIKVTYDDGSYVEYEYDEAGNREVVDANT